MFSHLKDAAAALGAGEIARNGLPMAPSAAPRRLVRHPFTGAELRFIRAEGQAREIARRLGRRILHAPPGALALAALVPTMAFALAGLADWRLAW